MEGVDHVCTGEGRTAKVESQGPVGASGWSVGGRRVKFFDVGKLRSDGHTTRVISRIPSCSLFANVGGGHVPKRKTHSTSMVHRDS